MNIPIQHYFERDRLYSLYHHGKISGPELLQRLRDLDDPPAQLRWTVPAVAVFAAFAGLVWAVWK